MKKSSTFYKFTLIALIMVSCEEIDINFNASTSLLTLEVNFQTYIDDYDYLASGADTYVTPSAANLTTFNSVVDNMISGNYTGADSLATDINYSVYEVTDTGNSNAIYNCLIPDDGTDEGQGIFCVYPVSTKLHHISVPHPVFDTNTDTVGVTLLRDVSFRYFSITTSHRCNSATQSLCDGTTTACDNPAAAFRISDDAHNADNYFQAFSQKVHDSNSSINTVQLHGCGSTSCPTGGAADIVSRTSVGTTEDFGSTALSNQFADQLELTYSKTGATSQSCNEAGDANTLCAATNTQGRYVNGSTSDPCDDAASPTVNSRFLHIEASSDLRVDSGGGDDITPSDITTALNAILD